MLDLVIIGGGCAGLSLARELANDPKQSRRVLVLEPRVYYPDDRTWCFWEKPRHPLNRLVRQRWSQWSFSRRAGEPVRQSSNRFIYQCIPAAAFYQHAVEAIDASSNVHLHRGCTVQQVQSGDDYVSLMTDHGQIKARHVVDTRPPVGQQALLWQQFHGVELRAEHDCFDHSTCQLMTDMHADSDGFSFLYVLPFDRRHALVERTRFVAEPLPGEQLGREAWQDVERIAGSACSGVREEAGCLPLGLKPEQPESAQLTRAGIAGGALRASSGYAFLSIQHWARHCARHWMQQARPIAHAAEPHWRSAMDRLFLHLIARRPELAPSLFLAMARRLPADSLVNFLGDQARLGNALSVVRALPKTPFLREVGRQLIRRRA